MIASNTRQPTEFNFPKTERNDEDERSVLKWWLYEIKLDYYSHI
ncbi:hypothetical protein FHV99_002562 [Ochrobactrum sp. P20RRXII]|nr:hypothetical protein [Ochrobactrum sp. P20RRXII]